MPENNWNGRKERSLCHRRCLKRYRRIVSLEALWRWLGDGWGVFVMEMRRK